MNRESPSSTRTVPSEKPYEGAFLVLAKEKKEALKKEIEKLKPEELMVRLEKFRDYIPGSVADTKDAEGTNNAFEMIALYQRSLQILRTDENSASLEVDTHFGKKTYQALLAFQKDGAFFQGKDIDGLPGPKTTKAILDKLSTTITKIPTPQDEKSGRSKGDIPPGNILTPDGKNPGSIRSLLSSIRQLEELQNPMKRENAQVQSLLLEAMKYSPISRLNGGINGSYYSGSSPRHIEYAVVKQKDGEYFIYDKVENGERRIYRTDKDFRVLVAARVDVMGKITVEKQIGTQYTIQSAAFMPTPKIIP